MQAARYFSRSIRPAQIKTVTVVGITGALGDSILQTLVKDGFKVQALTRSEPTHPAYASMIKKVNYRDRAALRSILEGQDAVVSCLGDTHACTQAQEELIKAAVEVGVQRFIPSEFGSDTTNAYVRTLPFFRHKVRHHDLLADASARRRDFSYTILITGLLLDWCLSTVPCIINVGARSAQLYDGGDIPFSTTRTKTVAAIVSKMLHNAESSRNRVLKVHETTTSQNELIRRAKTLLNLSRDFRSSYIDTALYEKRAWQAFTSPHATPIDWALPFVNLSVWSRSLPGRFERVDNKDVDLPVLNGLQRSAVLNDELLRAIHTFSKQCRSADQSDVAATAEEAYEKGRMKLMDCAYEIAASSEGYPAHASGVF